MSPGTRAAHQDSFPHRRRKSSCLTSPSFFHVTPKQKKFFKRNDTQMPKQPEKLYSKLERCRSGEKEGTSHPLNPNVPQELLPW